MEEIKLETETKNLVYAQSGEQLNQRFIKTTMRTQSLLSFVNFKHNLDEYLLRFERYSYANLAK